ncbi:MAG: ABC transporter permease [Anaerolineales bacterium]|jgi:simple sugar transport system permease protein|nr:ABC transporter permease [Anaerolineales bacterium]
MTEMQQQQPSAKKQNWLTKIREIALVPALAVFTGLLIGALVIVFSDANVLAAYGNFFSDPLKALFLSWQAIATAYGALFVGSFGSFDRLAEGLSVFFSTGESRQLLRAIYPFTESLVTATPYILTGLSVAIGFRAGLFNIGAEGQFFIGALCSAYVGYSIVGLPAFIHLPLALLAGAAGGAFWGAIPGFLKARFGAHEVVNTIMMNWIAFRLSDWLLTGPMKASGFRPVTPNVEHTAELPRLFADPLRFNWGFILALAMAGLVYWLLFKTTIGFELRSVGNNPDGAKYAGMSITRNIVLVMTLAGGLAGLAGSAQVLGVDHWVGQGFSAGYGFDSIALALLGKSHPLGVVLAGLLFGFLRSGATRMQSMAGIPIDIISVIQGLVIIFVAAPAIIRWIYRLKEKDINDDTTVLTRGWGR